VYHAQFKVDQVVTLDARGSYDEDQVGLSASAAGMSFGWSCVQVAPVLADSCSNVLSINSSNNEGTFVGRAGANAAGAVVQVTLTLLDVSQSRAAQNVVTITVLPSLHPVVDATSDAADTGILNSNRELQLVGEVTIPVGYNSSATKRTSWGIVIAKLTLKGAKMACWELASHEACASPRRFRALRPVRMMQRNVTDTET